MRSYGNRMPRTRFAAGGPWGHWRSYAQDGCRGIDMLSVCNKPWLPGAGGTGGVHSGRLGKEACIGLVRPAGCKVALVSAWMDEPGDVLTKFATVGAVRHGSGSILTLRIASVHGGALRVTVPSTPARVCRG